MKKLIVIALAVVMALAVVAFAACDNGETVTGSVNYTNAYGSEYGVKVDVTVKGGVITAVKLYTEEETGWIRTSADNEAHGWTGHDRTEAAYAQYIEDTFIGKTVEEVNAYVASVTAEAQTVTTGPKIEGSTQSAARIIVAVQNALSKLAA